MALENHPNIRRILDEGYEFQFGNYMERGLDLFKKDLSNYAIFSLVFLIAAVALQIVPFVGPMASSLVVTPVLIGGFYLATRKLDLGETIQFNAFFKGFDFLAQTILANLVSSLIALAALIPFIGMLIYYLIGLGLSESDLTDESEIINLFLSFPFWIFLFLLPAVYFGIAYSWAIPFVVLHKMEFWDALEASRRLITMRWFMFFLFSIVTGFIAMIGIILLGVGIIFTLPLAFCMNYAAFAAITKLNEANSEVDDTLIDHLIV